MVKIFIIIALMVSPVLAFGSDIPKSLKLATTDWCPYACKNNTNRGIVVDYVEALLVTEGIVSEVEFFPWSRAIELVRRGEYHALLTAVPSEAPGMLFTSVPTLSYEVCYFTNRSSSWQYQGVESLKKVNLGVVQSYSYGEPLDSYIQYEVSVSNITVLNGDRAIDRLFNMIASQRIDVLVDDRFVVNWKVKNLKSLTGEEFALRNAGCMDSSPFYMAVNPELTWAQDFKVLMDRLYGDSRMRKNLLGEIINKYE